LIVTPVAGVILTWRLFVRPHTSTVTRADAVVVLSGDFGDRLPRALALVRAGAAPTLVIDGQPDYPAVSALCRGSQPFEVVCLRPQPDSTRDEARAAATLAADRRWATLTVVTTKSHVTRTALLFGRCVDARVQMVGTEPAYDSGTRFRAVTHEWLGFAHALLLQRGC
jgi:uncharacterized SAM-binding protein YcdF (DUF218 family)